MPLLEITESTVECPWSGPVDFDVCMSCLRLRSVRQGRKRQQVHCATPTDHMESFLMFQEEPGRFGRIVRHRVA